LFDFIDAPMKNLNQAFAELTESELHKIVEKILLENVSITKWNYIAIGRPNVNPNTAGIFRIFGVAECRDKQLRWSVILKIIHWVNFAGTPLGNSYNTHPRDWNYWKREALVYSSGILDGLKDDLVPVKCYEVNEHDDGSFWLWLEDLQQISSKVDNADALLYSAHHIGQFGGISLTQNDRSYPAWLCNDFIAQWVQGTIAFDIEKTIVDRSIWQNELIKRAFPLPVTDRFLQLIRDSKGLIRILQRQKQTLCHNDCDQPNLFTFLDYQNKSTTVAIDWALLSIGPVGADLGTQLGGNIFHLFVNPSKAYEYSSLAVDAYFCGLTEAGWKGDAKSVRFACYATASLRYIPYAAFMLRNLANHELNSLARIKSRGSWHDTIRSWAEAIYQILHWSANARSLADAL
jgi:hypothetical protein